MWNFYWPTVFFYFTDRKFPFVTVTKVSHSSSEEESEEDEWSHMNDKPFVCTNRNCNITFDNEDDCRFHIKNLCNKPPRYKCPYCFYKSHHSSHVKRHIGCIHKGLKIKIIELYNPREESCNFRCSTCQKKYKHKGNLTKHLKYECGKPPRFKCSYCDFKNTYRGTVKTHSKRKHPNEEFSYENLQ